MTVTRLLCAKSRVAPLKRQTVPRLELCAAALAAQLVERVKRDIKLEDVTTYFWTDSEIVLSWINSNASTFQTFVANRIAIIQDRSIPQQWRHVRSNENPADILSRGLTPRKLGNCNLWFYGPPFLHMKESSWPEPYNKGSQCDLERKKRFLNETINNPPSVLTTEKEQPPSKSTRNSSSHFVHLISHGNSFRKLQRITAYVLRFVKRIRTARVQHSEIQPLTSQELDEALFVIVKATQQDEYKEEIKQLKRHNEVQGNSPLSTLTPFLDEIGMLRVGGRLEASSLSYDAKHPMLLPYSHQFTKLLMIAIHQENMHVAPQNLLAITRQRFWPIKGKTLARSVVQHCVWCAKRKPKTLEQIMGNLPPERVQPARPFIISGVDFCGPIWIHYKIRGKRPQKAYVAVFCCFATKAVHFEIVSDLTADAFIGALKRFIGRRGHCKTIFCDNATNFTGANNRLKELSEVIHSDKAKDVISSTCSKKGIDFKFIPPRAPHFGGLWEAAVKSAKHLLLKGTAAASLTYEELETLMVGVEAILNSRPLTQMSNDPNDLTALTPGHFLIGEPLTAPIDSRAQPVNTSLSSRWNLVSHIRHEFWRRWSREYLNELQCRYKWKRGCGNLKEGSIVIIKEDNIPMMEWPLARVVRTIKGEDGFVRVADVRTASGISRRAIHKLAPLPCDPDQVTSDTPSERNNDSDNEDGEGSSRRHRYDTTHSTNRNSSTSTAKSSDDKIPKKRARYSGNSSLMSLLLTCMMLQVIWGRRIEIKQFEPKAGLHFENLGRIKLISSEWKLVVYYDLQPYWMELTTLANGTNALEYLCSQMNQSIPCQQTVKQFQNIQNELNMDNEFISHNPAPERQKRGVLNIVGNVANSLFGILDSEYAEQMSKTIKAVNENEEHLTTLLRNQTSLIDSTINIMKADQVNIQQKFDELDAQFHQLVSSMNDTKEVVYQYKVLQLFTTLTAQLILISSRLQRIQASILEVLTDTHHGNISPLLLSPHQLRAEIITIKNHLPPALELPSGRKGVMSLYKLMTSSSRIVENHMIFRIDLPLATLELFNAFHVIPIPVVINDTLVAIEPSTEVLVVNQHHDQYFPTTEHALSLCSQMEGREKLCLPNGPIYRRGAPACKCEMNLLNEHHELQSGECKLRRVENSPVWIQLHTLNQWIYATRENFSVTSVCGDEVTSLVLTGSGLLNVQPQCIIKHDLITIHGHQIYPSNARTSYTRLGEVSQIASPERISKIIEDTDPYNSKLSELTMLQDKLKTLSLDLPNQLPEHTVHQFAVGYTATILVILVIIALLWKYRGEVLKCSKAGPTPAPRTIITAPQHEEFSVHI